MRFNHRKYWFAYYYILYANAEKAARAAGYSTRYARGNAYKLLRDDECIRYIADFQTECDRANSTGTKARFKTPLEYTLEAWNRDT